MHYEDFKKIIQDDKQIDYVKRYETGSIPFTVIYMVDGRAIRYYDSIEVDKYLHRHIGVRDENLQRD